MTQADQPYPVNRIKVGKVKEDVVMFVEFVVIDKHGIEREAGMSFCLNDIDLHQLGSSFLANSDSP